MKAIFIRHVIRLTLLLVFLGLGATRPADAQTYSFTVPELNMQVFVQPDGAARIVYDITFQNSTFASPIDIVDIGMPHADYDLGNMSASVDGTPVNFIFPSTVVEPGMEIHLGEKTIQPGETGTLHFEFTMPRLIYQDVTRRGYASLQITPTWFDEDFVRGTSNIQIAIHMLPGIQPDELLYQEEPFTQQALFGDHAVAVWQYPEGSATHPYLVGVSFPARGITSGIVPQTVFDLAVKWLEDNPQVRFFLGLGVVSLFMFLFFRFSGGTGISVFVLLSAGLVWLMVVSPAFHLISIPGLIGLIILNEAQLRRRRKEYLPAVAQVEGGGIKRGLTAPEAAALLELPLNKVLTLILFGLLKKEALEVREASPLMVDVVDPFRAQGKSPRGASDAPKKYRLKAAQEKGIVLHDYEHGFLDVIEAKPGRLVQELDFGKPMKAFIEGVAARMKSFDLSDTQDYYRGIIKRALIEAQSLGDIATKEKALDRNFEWILMDDRYPTIFHTRGYSYYPSWTRPIRTAGSGSGGVSRPSAPGAAGGRTSFGDVSAGFAGWAENTMGSLAAAISPAALQVPTAQGGFVNLSGADKVTADIFKEMAKSSSSRGGGRSGGGGCACACAGCACACACAGGGR